MLDQTSRVFYEIFIFNRLEQTRQSVLFCFLSILHFSFSDFIYITSDAISSLMLFYLYVFVGVKFCNSFTVSLIIIIIIILE